MLSPEEQAQVLGQAAKVFVAFFRASHGRNPDVADFAEKFLPHLRHWENQRQEEEAEDRVLENDRLHE